MPKKHRDFQKRRMGYVLGCLDKSMEHALELRSEFDKVIGLDPTDDKYTEKLLELAPTNSHAAFAMLLTMGIQQALVSQQTFEGFALKAWGMLPDSLASWRNTGQEYKQAHDG